MEAVVWLISDLHLGSRCAPTPPEWAWHTKTGPRAYFAKLQNLGYSWLMEQRKREKRLDLLLLDGDAVDGAGEKNSGKELVIPDLDEQVMAAGDLIRALRPRMAAIVRGSRYHTGKAIFLEDRLAKDLGIQAPLWENRFKYAGKVFSVRHKIAKTALQYTQYSTLAREAMQDLINTWLSEQDRSDVLVRAHVHRFAQLTYENILAFCLPGMQFPETDYGKAECSGLVHVGFVSVRIAGGALSWEKHQIPPRTYVRQIVDVTPQAFSLRTETAK